MNTSIKASKLSILLLECSPCFKGFQNYFNNEIYSIMRKIRKILLEKNILLIIGIYLLQVCYTKFSAKIKIAQYGPELPFIHIKIQEWALCNFFVIYESCKSKL